MADWTRAKNCSANSCIEVRRYGDGVVGIRNPKNSHGFATLSSPDEWAAFVAGVKAGDFDHIAEEATG
jgi:Domain of unknown function (DUF397)